MTFSIRIPSVSNHVSNPTYWETRSDDYTTSRGKFYSEASAAAWMAEHATAGVIECFADQPYMD